MPEWMDDLIWAVSGFTTGVISTLMVQDVRRARVRLAAIRAEFQKKED